MLKKDLGGGGGGAGGWCVSCVFWRFIHSQVYDDDGMYV